VCRQVSGTLGAVVWRCAQPALPRGRRSAGSGLAHGPPNGTLTWHETMRRLRRSVLVCALVVVAFVVPGAAAAARPYRAGQRVTLSVTKAGSAGDVDELLPDQCSRVTVTLRAPKSSIGNQSGASVATDSGRMLHAFGRIRRTILSWKLKRLRTFWVRADPLGHPPPYRLTAICVLTKRGANEYNALSGDSPMRRSKVRITYATPKVSQRGVLTVRASVEPKTTRCTLTLHGPNAHVINLHAKRSRSGRLQWRYRVGAAAAPGHWTARVFCGSRTKADRAFVVESPVLNANVAVVSDGFTQSNYSIGAGTFISYGAVLHDSTSNVDALNVAVTASFTDTLGRSVDSETTTLTGIPAGSTFYLGGLASSNVSLTVASMNVSVTVGSTQAHRLALPPVSGVGVQTDDLGDESVSGTFDNPYAKAIPSTAQIYVVYFNAERAVIGGASEDSGASVEPGGSVAFGFPWFSTDINDSFVPPSDVATIDGSVDPCGGILDTTCPAQVTVLTP
jgi:hypothetical protein